MPDPSLSRTRYSLLITCEHGGNSIPSRYRRWFQSATEALRSHRGYDPGSLQLARRFARTFRAPLVEETRSRLLIELNRSPNHPRLFSEFSRVLPDEIRTELLEQIYRPYRERVRKQIRHLIGTGTGNGCVFHLSVHTFTPVMKEKTRRTDIGLLFDPARPLETELATSWRRALQQRLPERAIHFNLPYRGTSDGLTTALRTEFPDGSYAGIELEVNQKFVAMGGGHWENILDQIIVALGDILSS